MMWLVMWVFLVGEVGGFCGCISVFVFDFFDLMVCYEVVVDGL